MGMHETAKLEWGRRQNPFTYGRDIQEGYICPHCGRPGLHFVEGKGEVTRHYCSGCENEIYVPSIEAFNEAFAGEWEQSFLSQVNKQCSDLYIGARRSERDKHRHFFAVLNRCDHSKEFSGGQEGS